MNASDMYSIPKFNPTECLLNALNRKAFGLLSIGFSVALLVGAGSGLIQHSASAAVGAASSVLVALYAINAAGYHLMCSAQAARSSSTASRPASTTLRWSLVHGHSLVCAFVLQLVLFATAVGICSLILRLCATPTFGSIIYACISPILVVGFALLVLGSISIMSLVAPAVWMGNGALASCKRLMRMGSRFWLVALAQLAQLLVLVAGLIAAIVILVGAGSSIVSVLAGMIMFSNVDLLLDQNNAHQLAERIGSVIAWGLSAMVPLLVFVAGLCHIGLNMRTWVISTAPCANSSVDGSDVVKQTSLLHG